MTNDIVHTVWAEGTEASDEHADEAVLDFSVLPGKWGGSSLGRFDGTVSWSSATTNFPGQSFDFEAPLTGDFLTSVRSAFNAWEAVANITFVEVADADDVDIRLGFDPVDGVGKTLGQAFLRYDRGNLTSARIRLDSDDSFFVAGTSTTGTFSFDALALHEIGHGIGLGHSEASASIMFQFIRNSQTTLGVDDIAGIQFIYGAPSIGYAGTVDNDTIYGQIEFGDTLFGGDGNDNIVGRSGDDVVDGEGGADTLFGDSGADLLRVGDGNDELVGGSSVDTLSGGAGTDILRGGHQADKLYGGLGSDIFVGNDTELAGDVIYDFSRGDVLVIEGLNKTNLQGAVATDRIAIQTSTFLTLDGLSAADGEFSATFEGGKTFIRLAEARVSLTGSSGADTLVGNNNDDFLAGAAGNDFLSGLAGRDTLYGSTGNDLLSGGQHSDVLYGDDGDDTLYAGDGVDTLFGGAGRDLLVADQSHNFGVGGAGNDTYRGAPSGGFAGITEEIDGGIDRLVWGASAPSLHGRDPIVLPENVEEVEFAAGSGAFILNGNASDNLIIGTRSGNVFSGLAGDDTISGGEGNDLLAGGVDNDSLLGQTGSDTLYGDAGNDRLIGDLGDDVLIGGAGADYLLGGDGNDVLGADAAIDSVVGSRSGNDTLIGGMGNDTYFAGPGDTIIEHSGEGAHDLLYYDGDYTLSGIFEQLWLTGTGEYTGVGSYARKLVTGSSGGVFV